MESWLAQLALLQGLPAYGLCFALLVTCGIGAPLNEDVVLLAAAALTLAGVMAPWPLIGVAWMALLLGDGLAFHAGHRFGPRLLGTRLMTRIVPPERLATLQDRVRRGGLPTIFLIRFMPGVRTALFFAAGTLKIRHRSFLLADGLAAAIELPLLVFGVRYVGGRWQQMAAEVQTLQVVLMALLVALALLMLVLVRRRRRLRGPLAEEENA
jgi:membrane protein DedA with SNARE-associated domain